MLIFQKQKWGIEVWRAWVCSVNVATQCQNLSVDYVRLRDALRRSG